MDKELLDILNSARAAGANESQLQGIIDAYKQKKNIGLNGSGGSLKSSSTDVLTAEQPKSNISVDANGQLQGASIFDSGTHDPLLQQPLQVQPQPQEVPTQNFTPDISNNFGFKNINEIAKQNVSAKDNTLVPPLPVLKRQDVLGDNSGEISDGEDEGVKLAKEYAAGKKLLDNQKNILASQILNIHQDAAVSKGDMQAPELFTPIPIAGEDKPVSDLHSAISNIDENTNQLKQETIKKAGLYAAKINADATTAGLTTRAILGDKNALQQSASLEKGYHVPPADMFYNDRQGLEALNYGLDEQYKDDLQNPEYISKKQDIADQSKTLIDKYPEFKTQQIAKIIAQQIMKDHPNDGMAVLPAAKEAIGKLGLTLEDIKNIDFDNLPIQSPLSSAAGAIYNGIISLGAGSARILGSAAGVDKDYLTSKLGEATRNAQQRFEDVSALQSAPSIVDADKTSPTYLQDVANPKAGKYNYNFHTVSNAIGQGIGALTQFVAGSKVVGGIVKGILPAVDATETGMAGLMIGQGYEPYYQKAREVISDKPQDEWKRNAYALINGSLDYYAFKGLGKVVKEISPEATKEVASIFQEAPSLEKVNRNALTNWATKVIKGAEETVGVTAFVGGAQATSEIAKNIVDNVVGTGDAGKKSDRELGNVLLTGAEGLWASILIPVGLSKIISGARGSYVYKENIYNAGLNPETYLGQANKLLSDGVINQDEFNQRAQVVNTAAKIVNSIPTDIELNHNQRVAYTNSKLRELALKAHIENVDDAALEKFYNEQIATEVANRSEVLKGGSKVNEFLQTEKPLTEGVNADEIYSKIISNPEVKDIEKTQPLQYFIDKAGENPVSSEVRFGKEITDKLLEKVPTEKLQENLDFLTKYNPDDPIVPVLSNLISERGKQADVRTPEQTGKLLDKNVMTPAQNISKVELTDPVTGETKTILAREARKQMESRHNILDKLINCL